VPESFFCQFVSVNWKNSFSDTDKLAMQMKFISLFSILISLLFFSCEKQETTTLPASATDSLHAQIVIFGSGGGFTGLWTGYAIEQDGSVMTWSGSDPDSSAKQFLKKLTPEDISSLDSILATSLPAVNDPGNFSYLIKYRKSDPVIWNSQTEDESKLTELYEALISRIENNFDSLD